MVVQHFKLCICFFVWFKRTHSPSDSYSENVPIDGPPSFRGQAVKYVYKLTIGCQRVNSPIKLLRVPFRVLVLQGEKNLDYFWFQLLAFCTTELPVWMSCVTLNPQEWWNVYFCFNTVWSWMSTFSFLTCRHARASISPGWGGFPFQPVPGGRGGEPQGCSAFGESTGHADGHHLKTLPPWVWFSGSLL